MDALWILLWTFVCVTALEIEECNKTIDVTKLNDLDLDSHSVVTFRHGQTHGMGVPYYCWYRLHGDVNQYIEVDVRDLNVGSYEEERCHNGYLRITDNFGVDDTSPQWLPPTTMCGNRPLRVKRETRGSSAFVEFNVDKLDRSQRFEFDAMFIDKDPVESLPYGHIQRSDGRINSTLCDWLVPVESCLGGCRLVSPGHPGIYPPNIRCRYTLMNFEHDRVQIKFGGKYGKFDLKRSEDCTEDYLNIYDGVSTDSPLIGRYCGLDSNFVVSSDTSLFLDFHAGPGGPPYDYTGFDIQVEDRWKHEHEFGIKVEDTVCDWAFVSSDSEEGDLHTPDHMIDSGTTCWYTFTGVPGEILEVRVKAYVLKSNCRETIEVWDDAHMLDRICGDRIMSRLRGTSFTFTSTQHQVKVKYHTKDKRISNSKPAWIYYTFINGTDDIGVPETAPAQDRDGEGYLLDSDDHSGCQPQWNLLLINVLAGACVMLHMAMIQIT